MIPFLSFPEHLVIFAKFWGDHADKSTDGQRPNGFRDLTKTKWRLTKGDEQLDFTYQHADIPHHISDELLSELTVCIYTARRLPLDLLRNVVRANYEPREYPSRMSRM